MSREAWGPTEADGYLRRKILVDGTTGFWFCARSHTLRKGESLLKLEALVALTLLMMKLLRGVALGAVNPGISRIMRISTASTVIAQLPCSSYAIWLSQFSDSR